MPEPVDTSNLDMLKDVIGDDLKDILQSFIDIAPGALADIRHAIDTHDADALRLHAHTLKGSSANVGATELPALCLTLETQGKDGQVTGLEANFKAVETETHRVEAFLQRYIDGL